MQMSFWGVLPEIELQQIKLRDDFIGLYMFTNFIGIRAKLRIGPHDQNIVSILVGSLLGDGYLERHGNGSR
jgi:hypothetical protein